MELDKHEVLRILLAKDVKYLHHANTVATVNAFFRAEQLLSRGAMEDKKHYQTSQLSDRSDRALNIWHDMFFDGSDIHYQASKRNIYGPVLLKFDLALLLDDRVAGLWIAKKNPLYWVKEIGTDNWVSKVPEDQRWFNSIAELEQSYSRTNFDYHIVIRAMYEGLPLNPYLREVVLDNPNQPFTYKETDMNWVTLAVGVLWASRRATLDKHPEFKLSTNFHIRKCNCRCQEEYAAMTTEELFHDFGF